MITEVKEDPKRFVIALYTRPNESFPSKLDVCVNGIAGILVEGQPCVMPRFLVDQAINCHSFTHREKPADSGDDTHETIKVRPNIDIRPIADEYQGADKILNLLKEAQKIKDRESPFYRLRMGVKQLVYGDMKAAEAIAADELKGATRAVQTDDELKAELAAKDKVIAEQANRLDRLEAMMEKMAGAALGNSESGSESKPTFEFNGKTYKTEAAMKAAKTKAEKDSANEDEPIEVDV
jgi:hypothetical protein